MGPHHGYQLQHPHSMPPHIMHHHHEMASDGNVLSNIRIMPHQPTAAVIHHQMPLTSRMTVTSMETVEGGSSEDDEDEDGESGEAPAKSGKGVAGSKPVSKIGKKKTGGTGRRRIDIKFIENKSRRQVTFSRRKRGLMKKAYELTTLTGTQALVLIASETGHVYTFATPKLQPVVTLREGKEIIQSCLNAPENNYPTSEFIANSSNSHGQNVGAGGPKHEPHGSPQQMQGPPHGHPHAHPHAHSEMLNNMYGAPGMPPHGHGHQHYGHQGPLPTHSMPPSGYPPDMYMNSGPPPMGGY